MFFSSCVHITDGVEPGGRHVNSLCLVLFAGNPHIGFLKHKEKLYVFSSREAALKFASNPEDIILKVEEKAQASPELNRLLRLNLQFSNISSSSGVRVLAEH